MTPDHTPSSPTVGAETTEQHLVRFYVELQAWIDDGCPVPSKFTPSMGLCGNLDGWCAHEDDDSICLNELLEDLDNSFAEAGLHDLYPFNNRGDRDYTDERRAGGTYRNPARLAWIKAHASPALSNGEHSRASPPTDGPKGQDGQEGGGS